MSFLYPDLKTALRGQFVAATMLSAGFFLFSFLPLVSEDALHQLWATGEALVDWKQALPDGMVKIGVSSRARDNQFFSSDPSTGTHLSSSPMLRDPYEAKVGS